MSSRYYENLIKTVIDNSLGKTWEEEVKEWEIIDCEEDEECSSQCVCGKENIKYLYLIHNNPDCFNYNSCRIFKETGNSR